MFQIYRIDYNSLYFKRWLRKLIIPIESQLAMSNLNEVFVLYMSNAKKMIELYAILQKYAYFLNLL